MAFLLGDEITGSLAQTWVMGSISALRLRCSSACLQHSLAGEHRMLTGHPFCNPVRKEKKSYVSQRAPEAEITIISSLFYPLLWFFPVSLSFIL